MAVCISLATLNKSQQGQLLFESRYNTAKQLHSQRHYIWLNDTPVGFVVKDNNSDNNVNNNGDWNIYAIHTDHLNTPRLLTNQNGAEVWRWASDAFGESAAVGSIEFNLRFPGQYYDGESGLHYNYFRDYNAQTGRYVQSDPIGLAGGLNTYVYVNGNPINYVDPFGLAPPSQGPIHVLNDNVKEASLMYSPAQFKDKVNNNGDWDYKNKDPEGESWEDFGNYHYGVTGAATGMFSPTTLLREAGANQCFSGNSDPLWGTPSKGAPFGDDPNDQRWIREGIQDYYSGMYGAPNSLDPLMTGATSLFSTGKAKINFAKPSPTWYKGSNK